VEPREPLRPPSRLAPARVKSKLRSELEGWTAAVRNKKLDRLAAVIVAMFDGDGPDLIGVCEVENEHVLDLLVDRLDIDGRSYKVAAHASPDARGIDVSFIYDENMLRVTGQGHQVVIKRSATRDIYWVELEDVATGNAFTAVGNHWPARSAGKYESEPYRLLTGETLSYVLEVLMDESTLGSKLPVLIMGDFNDEPFDRSMHEGLLGSRDPGRVTRASNPMALNLMWPALAGENPGTYHFGSDWNMLDSILATKGLLSSSSPVRVQRDTAAIFRPAFMTTKSGKPRRHGRPAKSGYDDGGYSDHFPITVVLESDD
jgi:endonuclease/exonuclease/phosphatase family metal-dependent hydrolase